MKECPITEFFRLPKDEVMCALQFPLYCQRKRLDLLDFRLKRTKSRRNLAHFFTRRTFFHWIIISICPVSHDFPNPSISSIIRFPDYNWRLFSHLPVWIFSSKSSTTSIENFPLPARANWQSCSGAEFGSSCHRSKIMDLKGFWNARK